MQCEIRHHCQFQWQTNETVTVSTKTCSSNSTRVTSPSISISILSMSASTSSSKSTTTIISTNLIYIYSPLEKLTHLNQFDQVQHTFWIKIGTRLGWRKGAVSLNYYDGTDALGLGRKEAASIMMGRTRDKPYLDFSPHLNLFRGTRALVTPPPKRRNPSKTWRDEPSVNWEPLPSKMDQSENLREGMRFPTGMLIISKKILSFKQHLDI